MPKFALQLKATCENLSNLQPGDGDFRWYIKLKCSNCGEVSKHWQYVSLEEVHEIDGSRGTAHLVEKCKLCGRQNQLAILPDSTHSYNVVNEDNSAKAAPCSEWQSVVSFDCRGIEPVDFDPRTGWTAVGCNSGTIFEVDLSDKEWCDYDEKAGLSVGVYGLEHRFCKC